VIAVVVTPALAAMVAMGGAVVSGVPGAFSAVPRATTAVAGAMDPVA
jgi:Flp pilus assembly pilin Flp